MNASHRMRRARSLSVVGGVLLLLGAVALVLELGEGRSAPPALGERWAVEGPAECLGSESELEVSQSGTWLRVRWAGATLPTMSGRLRLDGAVELDLVGAAACGTGGRLVGRWTPTGLDATLTLDGCADCPGGALTASPIASRPPGVP